MQMCKNANPANDTKLDSILRLESRIISIVQSNYLLYVGILRRKKLSNLFKAFNFVHD